MSRRPSTRSVTRASCWPQSGWAFHLRCLFICKSSTETQVQVFGLAQTVASRLGCCGELDRATQSLLDDPSSELRLSGLEISAGLDGKSASLRIDIDGKRKKGIVNPLPHLQVFGQPIPAVSGLEVQEYLGVPLSPMRTCADVAGKLDKGLRNLSSAPLKSQQRMYMLEANLLPAINHQLVLAAVTKKYLLWLD